MMDQISINLYKRNSLLVKSTGFLIVLVILFTFFFLLKPSNKSNSFSIVGDNQIEEDSIQNQNNRSDVLTQKVNILGKLLVQLEDSEKKSTSLKNTHTIEETTNQIKNLQAEIKQIIQSNTSHLSIKFNYKTDQYSCFIVNTNSKQHEINFHLKSSTGQHYESISNLYHSLNTDTNEVLMITNAGMYLHNLDPQGLLIEKSEITNKLNLIKIDNKTNFYMFPNGIFALDTNNQALVMETDSFSKNINASRIKYATQSGPMLVIDGKIHPRFINGSKNLNIRSGAGISSENKTNLIFIISNTEVNFYNFASAYKDLFNCDNALYLDGAISKMYLKETDKQQIPTGHFGPLISVTIKK